MNTSRRTTPVFGLVETWSDFFYQAQDRTSTLSDSYLNAFQDGYKTGFDLILAGLKQTHELQTLSFDYFQESVRASNEMLSTIFRIQDEIGEDAKERFNHHVTEIEKVAKAAQ